ncbi:MAG TPA: hypothetical protein VNO70_22645 [Blastocatellia bacterium]|nr:hypothetical protein [Blastocatellia bacterium]
MRKKQSIAFAFFPSLLLSLFVSPVSSFVTARHGAALRGRERLAAGSAALPTTGMPGGLTHPQFCNPAVVSYIVRDESGNVLSEAELRSIRERLPKSIAAAQLSVGEVSFADDGKSFYYKR